MLELFYKGGPLFMGILTILLIVVVAVAIINGLSLVRGAIGNKEERLRKIGYTRSVGLFALIIGVLGQLIGLFSAFQAIELGAVQVSPTIIAAGFKVSMITTMYGIVIYVISLMLWLGLSMTVEKSLKQ